MKFSLITPYLPSEYDQLLALKTNLMAQTTTDFEWLIAGTLPIDLDQTEWQAPFTIRQVHPKASTVGAVRNAAIAVAQGDWLVFIDSDDYLLPTALATVTALEGLKSTTFIDLNQYPTYEPHVSFVNSLTQTSATDTLPKWGGSKRQRLRNRSLNLPADLLTELPATTPASSAVQNWLTHKYLLFTGEDRFEQFGRQAKITGKILNRQLVEQHHWQFDETNALYPDYHFLTQAMLATPTYLRLADPLYVRVKHNDPINQPSIHQLEDPHRWHHRLAAWQLALVDLPVGPLHVAFSRFTLDRLHRYLYQALATSSETTVADSPALMDQLHDYLQLVDPDTLRELPHNSRQILRTIRRQPRVPQFQINVLVRLRQLNRVIRHRGRGITRLAYNWWFTKLPIKPRTILYESFLGRNFSDSPKAIYNYLEKNYPGRFHHVWVMNPGVSETPAGRPNTKVVKRFGWRYMYYLATAKFQVINMRQPKWFIKRPGTKFLATWHGTPLKHLVFDMDNVASANPLYKSIFYQQSRQWDYLVTANQFSVDVFEHAFMYPTDQMLPSGYPRNDILSAPDKDEQAQQIKRKLGIPLDKKIILYAPTWRDDDYYGVGDYKFTLKLDIDRLKRELGDEYVLVLRTHYFITEHLDTTGFGDFVYNESSYDDISELYLIADVLITDYSSVFFDYAILKRPILYFVYDYEKYGSVLRGFYLNMETDLPGPLLKTNDDVLAVLHDLPAVTQQYAAAYQRFSQRFNAWEDGHASQRVVDTFFADELHH